MHLIWLSFVVPGMLCVLWTVPESRQPWIWLISFAIAILGLVGIIGFDLFGFLAGGGNSEHGFMRAVFALIMLTDVPLVALALGSSLNWLISRRSRKLV